jgi:fucose permease
MCDSLLTPLACAAYPDRRTRASNLLHAFYAIGLGGGVGLVLVASRLGASWRTTAGWLALSPVIYAATMLALALPRRTHGGMARLTSRRLVGRRDFLLLVGAMVLAGATEYGPMTWLPSFVGLDGGSVGLQAGLGMGLFAACMLAGRLGTLALSDRLGGPVRVVLTGAGMCTGCLLVAALPIGSIGRIVAIAGVGLAVAAMWPTLLALAGDRFPQAGASMFAILAAGGATGCALAPAAIGVIGERSSLAVAIATTAACPLGVLGLVAALRRSHRADRPVPEQLPVKTRRPG